MYNTPKQTPFKLISQNNEEPNMTTDYHSRQMLGSEMFEAWEQTESDQKKKLPMPPKEKPVPEGSQLIDLPAPETFDFEGVSVLQAMRNRKSRREYKDEPLSLSELAFLCWATQGVRALDPKTGRMLRIVPSAGARQPFETYLGVRRVEGLEMGLYRYLSLSHQLCLLWAEADIAEKMAWKCAGFARQAAVTFIWTAIPYRTEWRYASVSSKLILQDSGHVCQNMYLACEAIGCGTCAVSAYGQHAMDEYLGLDGESELTVYCAPVGRV